MSADNITYANIIVDISHSQVDRPFQYRIPEHLKGKVVPGVCVSIPFGKGDTIRKGYCLEVVNVPEIEPDRIKDVKDILPDEESVETRLIKLAAWMKRLYGATMIDSLKTVLPVRHKVGSRVFKRVYRKADEELIRAALLKARARKQFGKERLLEELIREKEIPYELLVSKLHVSPQTIKSMEKAGLLEVRQETKIRGSVSFDDSGEEVRHELSAEQRAVVEGVLRDYDAGKPGRYLLHGITGSGKTEVYLRLVSEMAGRGRQTIVLIPEISLTYQNALRFYKRFGDRVSILNSSMSAGERYDQCMRAASGELDVMIGPRSALFTPFRDLGLIIMDEEQEESYKSENMPKYHARETALELAGLHGASVLLGSATPSIQAYAGAMNGDYKLYELTKRLTGGTLPKVHVVDLREELRSGNRSVFSVLLQDKMKACLEAGEQAILFINRRGYAGFVSCRSCGYVVKCEHCDISLSEHLGGKMICHYCGYEAAKPKVCPQCGSGYISGFRAGTQQIEEHLQKMYPKAGILRMDADTTRTKNSYQKILSAFSNREADILLGTQMIVKGHDFPNVTLVGVLAADMSLSAGDYRAGERTFDLITQAAGRAGRGELPGEVVIQTYNPEHYALIHGAAQDYKGFYREEMLYRKMLRYPPAFHMLCVQITSPSESAGRDYSQVLAKEAETVTGVIGPTAAGVGKIKDLYRFMFFCKEQDENRLVEVKDLLEQHAREHAPRDCRVQFDYDPVRGF